MKIKTNKEKFYATSLALFGILVLIRWTFGPFVPYESRDLKEDMKNETEVSPLMGNGTLFADIVEYITNRNEHCDVENLQLCKYSLLGQSGSKQNVSFSPHPIRGVHSYDVCFPDLQEVQIVAAKRNGVEPPRNREDAEARSNELVYVGASPFYGIDGNMTNSIPFLVPRAALLLQKIGRNFQDSLYVKGLPLHKFIVTSVLRSEEDVTKLSATNGNVSTQSCHRFGTTFDICYTRYVRIQNPEEPRLAPVRDDTLKWVLSEVLRDLRADSLCYIKHEVKQSCFHITVR